MLSRMMNGRIAAGFLSNSGTSICHPLRSLPLNKAMVLPCSMPVLLQDMNNSRYNRCRCERRCMCCVVNFVVMDNDTIIMCKCIICCLDYAFFGRFFNLFTQNIGRCPMLDISPFQGFFYANTL